ncbi:dienelactone hydrolase family protein [Planctomonas psychrotolerans]|uniref:dienelactone hydrolase family protein n=1 Tax=Planctomonas psychrotolerans TaxID=2528712 RepID=UPI00123AF70C|nr:dienelactone hydrolase family protein [Planctomonas psychrotolerans]
MTPSHPPASSALLETVPLRAGASISTDRVIYAHDGVSLDGYLALDESIDGPRPGILVLHDWTGEGDYTQVRAQMLARLGYVALVADLYGAGVRPTGDGAAAEAGKYYGDLPLLRARVQAGFDQLAAHPAVDAANIVVIGYCFGGSAALEFARTGADVRGVVSFHGGLIAHNPADVDAIRASLLILTGGNDPVVPDSDVQAFQDELRTVPDLDWEVVTYSGAPHAFTLPETDMYRPVADARSWQRFLAFLDEVLAPVPAAA